MSGAPATTVTLATDLEASTQTRQHLHDHHPDLLAGYTRVLCKAAEERGGRQVAARGEQILFTFRRASNAVAGAVTAQRLLRRRPQSPGGVLSVRMGLDAAELPLIAVHAALHEHPAAGICASGYGGQILASDAARRLLIEASPPGITLRSLGVHRLRDLRRVEPLYQIEHPDLPAGFPPVKALDVLPNNLPAQLTAFIGREREILEVKRLLTKTRLLTLTGAGGCGKTRLALHIAADLLEDYNDGGWLIDLAALSDPALIPHAVASAIGVREPPGRALTEALVERLRAKSVLLLLDNCEHLVAGCAEFADGLLRACPNVSVLATSREPLGTAGEATYRVPSLSVPPRDAKPTVEQAAGAEAVRLFVDRAAFGNPGFRLTPENTETVVVTCRRLDGIPLAIELAAAQVRSLSVGQIAQRLDDRFRLLSRGNRAAPARHRTLRAAIDWSYLLLTGEERVLLRRLAVFSGGCTLEAAGVVCGGPPLQHADLLEILARLVEKSLVIAEDRGEERRYRMLETVREYTRTRLVEAGEADAIPTRCRDWYLDMAVRAAPEMRGPHQGVWLERLETELDNLRAALAWSRDRTGEAGTLLRLAVALWRFWFMRGRVTEGRKYLEDALERDRDAPPRVVLKALDAAAHLARQLGDYPRAVTLAERGLALAREHEDREGTAMFLDALGIVAGLQGDLHRARTTCEGSLALWRELGDKWQISTMLRELGAFANFQGDYAAAAAYCTESLELARDLGDQHRIAFALKGLGDVALRAGDTPRAAALLAEALTLSRETGNLTTTGMSLEGLTAVAAAEGRYDRAARLAGAAEALREAHGWYRAAVNQRAFEACTDAARASLPGPAFLAAWEAGRAMTPAEAIEYALAGPEEKGPTAPAAPKRSLNLLAPREREVAALIARGLTNRDIAVSLAITERTAETHVQHILNKLGFASRAQIAAWAVEQRFRQG